MSSSSWSLNCCLTFIMLFASAAAASAQVTLKASTKTADPPQRTVPAETKPVPAPQVVTILHRLNGLKLFRLMARENQRMVAIAQLDEAFKIMGEVHTNVIAGVALNDGQTIVARLPEVEAELGTPRIPYSLESPLQPSLPAPPQPPKAPAAPFPPPKADDFLDEPDITVIARDGRRFPARYVGLDGVTGLSVIRLLNRTSLPVVPTDREPITIGEHLRLFGPEPSTPKTAAGSVSVRIGEIDGTVTNMTKTPAGGLSKMKLRSSRLTAANIGSIAVNDSGQTVGIVENIEHDEASLLSRAQITNAASRVLARQSSVPRPWLGVSGEPIESLAVDDLINSGWQRMQANTLTQERSGILLTSVAPDSPAAIASLRSGDVILRVNGEEIKTGDDFSWLLAEAGPGNSASFTVMRPDRRDSETINLRLSGGFTPRFPPMLKGNSVLKQGLLITKGIETVALMPAVAARLGATEGLLVIYVQPETAGFKAGLLAGDVIETINGQHVSSDEIDFSTTPASDLKFELVRRKLKMTLTIPKDQR